MVKKKMCQRDTFFIGKWLLMVAICCLSTSCQQLPDEGLMEDEKSTLEVKARSLDNQNIIYPLSLYVFDSKGICVDTRNVENEDDETQLTLAKGEYWVVAISACKDDYAVSSVKDLESTIELVDADGAEIPLVMGKAKVTMDSNTKGKLDIVLANYVTAIDVALSGLPADVAEVVVTMHPFYSSINMKGECVGDDYSLKLPCTLDTKNRWSTKTCYLFPGSGEETILSIWLKLKNGEEMTYGYTWKSSPEANQPYHLLGDYSEGLTLNGSFTLTAWNDPEDVNFDFGILPSPDEEEDEGGNGDSEIDLSGLPEIGTIWNGTIVADIVEADDWGADLLLMSLDEWDATTSSVEDVISGYGVNGISDWRLPNHDEAAVLRARFSGDNRLELNGLIEKYDSSLYGIDGEERYLCTKNGLYYSFKFMGSSTTTKAGEKRYYYVRLVKTYRMVLDQ